MLKKFSDSMIVLVKILRSVCLPKTRLFLTVGSYSQELELLIWYVGSIFLLIDRCDQANLVSLLLMVLMVRYKELVIRSLIWDFVE